MAIELLILGGLKLSPNRLGTKSFDTILDLDPFV